MSTTIRVSRELHERLARRASEGSATLSTVIEHALDVEEAADFWGEVRRTMVAPGARAELSDGVERDAAVLKDGLDPAGSSSSEQVSRPADSQVVLATVCP